MIRMYSCVPLILLFFASRLSAVVLDCPEALSALVYEIQRASLGEMPDAVARLQERLGHSPKDHPQGLFAFESDVLSLIETSPKLRAGALSAFQNKWNLTTDELLDVMTYYSIRVFYDEPSLAGDPRKVFSRLQEVGRIHYLTNPENSAARQFAFYQANLTNLSIPGMALRLNISEGEVYRELSLAGLSPVQAFNEKLTVYQRKAFESWIQGKDGLRPLTPTELQGSVQNIAQVLLDRGVSLPELAEALGVGEQALKFIRHHSGEQNRGVEWNRTVHFEGKPQWEVSVLVQLRERGLTTQAIADRLNQLFDTPSDHENTRTAASVQSKLDNLQLTNPPDRTVPDIYDPEYGYLKRSGKLVPENALKYIFDNAHFDDANLAKQLGVQEKSLREFFQRHYVVRFQQGERPAFRVERKRGTKDKVSELLNRYVQQEQAVDLYLDWVKLHGRLPISRDFGHGEGQLDLLPEQFFGTGNYRSKGGKNANYRYFDGTEEAMLALRARAKERGIEFSILDRRYHEVSETFRKELQTEAMDRYLDWVRENKRQPINTDFGTGEGKLELIPKQLFGVGVYSKQIGSHAASRYFDGVEEAMLALRARAKARGIEYSLLDRKYMHSYSDDFRKELQTEAVDRYLDWTNEKGQSPGHRDFGFQAGQLQLDPGAFFATGDYSLKGKKAKSRYFDGVEEAMLALQARAKERKIEFSLLDQKFRYPFSDVFRKNLQEEAVDRYLNWVEKNGGQPTNLDFGTKEGQLRLSEQQFFGVASYASDFRYFDGTEEALLALRSRARQRKIEFSLLDHRYKHAISVEFRKEMQTEAVDRYLVWVQKNGRTPTAKDFGYQEGQLKLNHGQFFATGEYRPQGSRANTRFFDNRSETEAAIANRAKELGVALPTQSGSD